jgi:hypothetical protein
MRFGIILLVLLGAMVLPSAARAEGSPIVCVRDQLNALGLDAGSSTVIDEQMVAAGERYREFMRSISPGWNMDSLTRLSVRNWCRSMSGAFQELRVFFDVFEGAEPPPVPTGNAMACVQAELKQLGYRVGTADGKLGKQTLAAAAKYDADQRGTTGYVSPPLNEQSAGFWCQRIASAYGEVKPIYLAYLGQELPAFDPDFDVTQARYVYLFDRDYYLKQLADPDAARNDPLGHYMSKGWKEGHDPSPWFDVSRYLEANPDVAESGVNPFEHYVTTGIDELRGFGETPDESGVIFEIGKGVRAKQEAIVREGIAMASAALEEHYGGDVPEDIRRRIIVKIDGQGKGNPEPGSKGGNATGLSIRNDRLPRPYFDFGHRDTNQDTSGRGWTQRNEQLGMVIHEYVHGWAAVFGGQTTYEQPLGNWINEGIATSIAVTALVDAGKMDRKAWDRFQINASLSTGEAKSPLAEFGVSTQTKIWLGHIGYLAIEWLVAESPNGRMSLRILNEEVVRTNSVKTAFRMAFNVELESFYEQFEVWRKMMLNSPNKALNNRPALVNIGEAG